MLKYIITKDGEPILFSKAIQHSDMANHISEEIVSAGFVTFKNNEAGIVVAQAFGHSMTLNLRSQIEDSDIITKHIVDFRN